MDEHISKRLQRLEEVSNHLREDNDKIREDIMDLNTILPSRHRRNVENWSVEILDGSFGVGAGLYCIYFRQKS